MYPENDTEYREHVIESVDADGRCFTFDSGTGFCVPEDSAIPPQVGDVIRIYGRGFGYAVRGLFINGQEVYYRTPVEEESHRQEMLRVEQQKRRAAFEANRTILDARYDGLPAVFKKRLDRFRINNPDFRVEFESYELFACDEAIKIAEALGTAERVNAFSAMDYEEQKRAVPSLDDGHSNNTLGCAVRLAYQYLTNPELVAQEHGAMAYLVGCKEYGCSHCPTCGGFRKAGGIGNREVECDCGGASS